ncbi:uncharacterized protein BDZ99DRAFT_461928 [Mytilinidion resinicola]|uniref:F-box domain-containing protein n=1 Tax=Mytilinidion resinicola TaxID=574789 RepID=A0A6A6YT82_9PEZI|nr:uncharacterized protein BDZ99DRAFT_461928 [Mytilinidion resinicola]KAF2811981.1 hypothetical protein BDZ99DRAFT_461928 [Mytilinidion resinicola]
MPPPSDPHATSRSFLLELPTELRLAIYDFALSDPDSITITSAPVAGDDPRAPDYIPRNAIPGLPAHHVPLVRSCYDASLLSIINPISVDKPQDCGSNGHSGFPHPTSFALLQTSRQINVEVAEHIRFRAPKSTSSGLSLYASYPHGLLVLKALYPSLLRQARSVHICGYYTLKPQESTTSINSSSSSISSTASASTSMSATSNGSDSSSTQTSAADLATSAAASFRVNMQGRRPRVRLPTPPPHPVQHQPHPAETTTLAGSAMASLVRTLLPPAPTAGSTHPLPPPLFKNLELRVYYPDECAYSQVWSDDGSPVIDTLRNTSGGLIDMEVWRGRRGCGVAVKVRPNPGGRVVSTVWRRFEDAGGIGGRAKEGIWVLGEDWGKGEVAGGVERR